MNVLMVSVSHVKGAEECLTYMIRLRGIISKSQLFDIFVWIPF